MGGLRALQTGTAKALGRFTASKAPRIEKYPEIHNLAQKAPAGSACKQDVHRADGLKRVDLLNRFAEIYRPARDVKTARKPCPYPPNPATLNWLLGGGPP